MNPKIEKFKQYEKESRIRLKRNEAAIVRVDMRKSKDVLMLLNKPFDDIFSYAMGQTMLYMCQEVQGCMVGYSANDEISIVLSDEKGAWFDWDIQDLVSNVASIATMRFAETIRSYINHKDEDDYISTWSNILRNGITFKGLCFNLPARECANYILLRKQIAQNNSVQILAKTYFSHQEIQNKSCEELKSMLLSEKEIDWNKLELKHKNGIYCMKSKKDYEGIEKTVWSLVESIV